MMDGVSNPFPDSIPLTAADLDACPQPEPPPDSPYQFFALSPLYVSQDGVHFYQQDAP